LGPKSISFPLFRVDVQVREEAEDCSSIGFLKIKNRYLGEYGQGIFVWIASNTTNRFC
jgi:hypothetical protein